MFYLDLPVLAVGPSRQRDPGRSKGGGAMQNQHQDVVAGGADQDRGKNERLEFFLS